MKLAMVFPGQGSQAVGMSAGLSERPEAARWLRLADDALGEDLSGLMARGPAEELNRTVNAQPALLTVSWALYREWLAAGGPPPELAAGHSLGEYTALTAAGCFEFPDAVRLVRARALAMQSAAPLGTGAMAAVIGLDDEAVADVCRRAAEGETVECVNYNCPGQVVIAGHRGAVERARALALAAGARRALELPVSGPFHSSLMRPAAPRLLWELSRVDCRPPRGPAVLANVDASVYAGVDDLRRLLPLQVASPVRWTELVRRLAALGATHVVELGPGRVLSGLIRRVCPELRVASCGDPAGVSELLDSAFLSS